MKALDSFLTNLSDHELAIFCRYRYHGFLGSSKEKIANEIKKRKLTTEQLKSFEDKKLTTLLTNEKIKCFRCGSDRLYIESDYKEIPIAEFTSAEIAIDSYRCRLCGYNASKTTPNNVFDRIKRVFKNFAKSIFIKYNDI